MGDEQQMTDQTPRPVEERVDVEDVPSHYIAKSQSNEQVKASKFERFKEFVTSCRRVLLITKKPDREEFKTIVKISGAGILIIGALGFLVSVIKDVFF